jgi:tRNA U54 and U55 pseudouridine synthase Pus10
MASPLWEQKIIEEIQKDLDGIGIGKISQNKRKFKQQWKQDKYDKHSNSVKSGGSKGAEQIISNISKLAAPLLKEITIHKHEIARTNLNELMTVECSMENLLLYGRYVKLSREVSQTPWNISTKKMVSYSFLTF